MLISFFLAITAWQAHKSHSSQHSSAHLQLAKTTNTSEHVWNDTQKSHPLSLSLSLPRQTLINELKRDTHWLHLRLVWRFLMTHCHHLHPWLSALSGKTLQWMWRFLVHSANESFHTLHMHTHTMDLAACTLRILQRIHYLGVTHTHTLSLLVISFSLSLFARVTDIQASIMAELKLKCDDVTANLALLCTTITHCIAQH